MFTLPHDVHSPTRCSHSRTMFTLAHDVHTPARCAHSHTISVNLFARCSHSHTISVICLLRHLPESQGNRGITSLTIDCSPSRPSTSTVAHNRLFTIPTLHRALTIDCSPFPPVPSSSAHNRLSTIPTRHRAPTSDFTVPPFDERRPRWA
jgi:hypothetical protein